MPCPVFYPTKEVSERTRANGRLPLIDEYAGLCKAESISYEPDRDTLFRACNHGYAREICSRLAVDASESCLRYSVISRAPGLLEIVCVEEFGHEPRRWYKLQYLVDTAEIRGDAPSDCVRAQALAFCGSYLRRFPIQAI